MVSHPETGSDPPIGWDQESGRDSVGCSKMGQIPPRVKDPNFIFC